MCYRDSLFKNDNVEHREKQSCLYIKRLANECIYMCFYMKNKMLKIYILK